MSRRRSLLLIKGNRTPYREPGAFASLWTKTDAEISTEYASRRIAVVVAGAGAISAQAGTEYSINGGSRTSASGTISDGNILQVFLTSSDSYETEVVGGITIDAIDCDFSITTMVSQVATYDELSVAELDAMTNAEVDALNI